MSLRVTYNSPLILTYALICAVVYGANLLLGNSLYTAFSLSGTVSFTDPLTYFRLVSYVVGHNSVAHLAGNLSLLLLIGPGMEEKYGWQKLLWMMFFTASATALLNLLIFDSGIVGASGIVFMLIVLSSFTNVREGEVPLTFIFVVVLYLGAEVFNAIFNDNVSQFAHIMGGVCGSLFGFNFKPGKEEE